MKTIIRHLFYIAMSLINLFIPKKKKIVIYGGEFLDDNSEAMFRYLIEHTDYEVACICNTSLKYDLRPNVYTVRNTYWNAFREMATAQVAIDSSFHTIKFYPTKKQMFIQCWHGSPLKSMVDPAQNGRYYSRLFYASEYFRDYMRGYFHADKNNMICLGAPRNDYLYNPQINEYKCEDYSQFKYKVVWMPTFRQGLGRIESSIDIPIVNSDNIRILDEKLKTLNVALIIKPHRMQERSFEHLFEKMKPSNISIITADYFIKYNIPVYTFLSFMDALITDYSSVYFDYLLLDRPIGFAIDDYDQYLTNRGFAYDDPLEMMPGKKIYSFEDLVSFFDDLDGNVDTFSDQRKIKAALFNKYRDNNCERCKQLIDDFIGS